MTIADSPATVRSADGTTIAIHRSGRGARDHPHRPGTADAQGSAKLSDGARGPILGVTYDRRGRGGSGDGQSGHCRQRARDRRHRRAHRRGGRPRRALRIVVRGRARPRSGRPPRRSRDAGSSPTSRRSSATTPAPPLAADLPAGSRHPSPRATGRRPCEGVLRRGGRSAALRRRDDADAAALAARRRRSRTHSATTSRCSTALSRASRCPSSRWSGLTAPTIVMVGAKSEPFFHHTARALADAPPTVGVRVARGRPPRLAADVARCASPRIIARFARLTPRAAAAHSPQRYPRTLRDARCGHE